VSAPTTAAIVAVGNELLFGETVDTNSAWLGRTLSSWGITVVQGRTVRDRVEEIQEALGGAIAAAELVVVTGGLGPTLDDLTKGAVAAYFGVGLRQDEGIRRAVAERFRAAGLEETPRLSEGQSEVLEGSVALANERGTAPGILFAHASGILVLVPGVPAEMRVIVSGPLRKHLEARGMLGVPVRHRLIHTTGIPETRLAEALEAPWSALPQELRDTVGLAYLPEELGVRVRLSVAHAAEADADAALDRVEGALAAALAPWRFEAESGDLADAVAEELLRAGASIATAESCTGGLVAKRLTDRPGSSRYVLGGIVAYDNAVKVGQLGVDESALAEHGAVSDTVARQMAVGARTALGADVAVSVTGVAGPGGGTPEKPVGTVWIGVATATSVDAELSHFAGDRGTVRRRSAQAALARVYRRLRSSSTGPELGPRG